MLFLRHYGHLHVLRIALLRVQIQM